MSLFLVSVATFDGDLTLGACARPEEAQDVLQPFIIRGFLAEHGCNCCGKLHAKTDAEEARLKMLLEAHARRVIAEARLERIG